MCSFVLREVEENCTIPMVTYPDRKRQAIGRMQIGITDDCEGFWAWGHQPNGIGKMEEVGEMSLTT